MKRRALAWIVAVAMAPYAAVMAQKPAPAPQPQTSGPAKPAVRSSIDRTAMWVGDRVTYTVEIESPRGYDVLEDDLSKDKLKLDGLDIVSTETTRTENPDGGATRRFHYVLSSYRVDAPSVTIAPFPVRYYATRAGQRLEDSAPAGSVDVPGAIVAVRSMLPDAQKSFELRDERTPDARPVMFAMARPVGMALVIVSIVPAVIWGAAFVGRRRRRTPGRSVRQARRDQRASLDAVRGMSMESPDGRREAYNQIDTIVRQHLQDLSGVPGPSLTPAEVEPALAGRPSRLSADRVAALLLACETARYGPPESLPSAEACRDALAETEQLLGTRQH